MSEVSKSVKENFSNTLLGFLISYTSLNLLVLSVDPGYPRGAPLHNSPVGVPLSCRFFIRGFPPNKNAACGYP